MEAENKENIEKLNQDYVLAIRNLQLLKKDKTNSEIADLERRCQFIKYTICKLNTNEDVAGAMLQSELSNYTNLVDDRNGLNNYWEQFASLNVKTENNPREWKSDLPDPSVALQFLEALPCNTKNTEGCKNSQPTDQDVKKMMELWKNAGNSPLPRKVRKEVVEIKKQSTEASFKSIPNQYSISVQPGTSKSPYFSKNEQRSTNREEEQSNHKKISSFKTARESLAHQSAKNKQPVKKTLGGRGVTSPYINPFKNEQEKEAKVTEPKNDELRNAEPVDERLKNIEPKMIELIKNEIMDCGNPISWNDIAGLEHAKKIIREIVVFPMLRPDIFTGLRRPPKGILLFGPPGTGKTLIGKCIASQSKSTFFSISASSLTSKWIGEGEKMVRALFAVAQVEQPSVVFIDEIDSLLCQRSETEHESSRRMKTEFLVQLDGAATGDEDRILVIGATNRPYELDEAARRRLVKRLYIPLPELEARAQIIHNLLKTERNNLTDEEIREIAKLADGYSGADMTNLCKEASMGPIRTIPFDKLENISKEDVREVTFNDFKEALDAIRPSVSQKDLAVYIEWNNTYGTTNAQSRK